MLDNKEPFSLKGKTVLVTGASSGIGRQVAISCSEQGAKLVITARREEALKETLLSMDGVGHQLVICDLTKSEDRLRLVSLVPELDGLVHCAGVSSRMPCKQIDEKHISSLMEVNFISPVLLQTEILKRKKLKRGGSIVFLASRASVFPSPGNAIYSASKGALISYSKCLGLELSARKIRVNSICPAMVWTDLIKNQGIEEDTLHEAELRYPLKRFGVPEDVANLAVYLLSDASSWMTGSCIDLTGGGEGTLV